MKTVIELAEEAGFERLFKNNEDWVCFTEDIEALVELARADEREAIDQLVNDDKDLSDNDAIRISKAIQARGNK